MTEDEEGAPPDPGQDSQLLLYDFFKHLTSLSILVLGGVLIVAQAADPQDVKPWVVVAVLILVSAGGVLAFTGSSEIVRSHYTATPAKPSIRWLRSLAPALLAMGVGMFLSMFVDSLN